MRRLLTVAAAGALVLGATACDDEDPAPDLDPDEGTTLDIDPGEGTGLPGDDEEEEDIDTTDG